jgi:hypothetical protein
MGGEQTTTRKGEYSIDISMTVARQRNVSTRATKADPSLCDSHCRGMDTADV